mmetsp:Transcript_129306/g.258185  ORF Transcript_129306/g.258185 Transcript_129306/m.258185 type:complete len:217 (-) Transcript_129306:70-720(-)
MGQRQAALVLAFAAVSVVPRAAAVATYEGASSVLSPLVVDDSPADSNAMAEADGSWWVQHSHKAEHWAPLSPRRPSKPSTLTEAQQQQPSQSWPNLPNADADVIAAAARQGGWTPVVAVPQAPRSSPPGLHERETRTANAGHEASFVAFRAELQQSLVQRRARMRRMRERERLVIHESHMPGMNIASVASNLRMTGGILGGLVLVACLIKFGVFVQ